MKLIKSLKERKTLLPNESFRVHFQFFAWNITIMLLTPTGRGHSKSKKESTCRIYEDNKRAFLQTSGGFFRRPPVCFFLIKYFLHLCTAEGTYWGKRSRNVAYFVCVFFFFLSAPKAQPHLFFERRNNRRKVSRTMLVYTYSFFFHFFQFKNETFFRDSSLRLGFSHFCIFNRIRPDV